MFDYLTQNYSLNCAVYKKIIEFNIELNENFYLGIYIYLLIFTIYV